MENVDLVVAEQIKNTYAVRGERKVACMVFVNNVRFGFGSVRYVSAQDEVPATSETQGNVTIKNMGSPGQPARFEVSFSIRSDIEVDGASAQNFTNVSIALHHMEASTPYLDVESEAAGLLPSALRKLADAVEIEIERFGGKSSKSD